MGGVALFLGFAMAIMIARALPTLRQAFTYGPDFDWLLIACAIICLVGVLDDRYELDSLTKLAGQSSRPAVMVTKGGVQLTLLPQFWGHAQIVYLGSDLAVPITILLTVLAINAVNFIDGLDGLAAGVTAIGAGAFFIYAYHLAILHDVDVAAAPALLSAALAGACVGFLPTTSPRRGCSWAIPGRCWSGCCCRRPRSRRPPRSIPRTFQSRARPCP